MNSGKKGKARDGRVAVYENRPFSDAVSLVVLHAAAFSEEAIHGLTTLLRFCTPSGRLGLFKLQLNL